MKFGWVRYSFPCETVMTVAFLEARHDHSPTSLINRSGAEGPASLSEPKVGFFLAFRHGKTQ